jgi:hypothetical protein
VSGDLTQYNLHQLWDMVRQHDHKYVYRHVQAWDKMGGLCDAMAKALRDAAAAVADRWPPNRSEAARAFSDRMHLLADAFERAQHNSYVNGPNLNVLQIENAAFRGNIGTLVTEWEQTQQRAILRGRELHLQRAVAAQTEDGLLAQSNTPPYKDRIDRLVGPVANDWKLEYDRKARQIAAAYEAAVSDYKGRFQPPEPVLPTLTTPAVPGAGTRFPGGVGDYGDYPGSHGSLGPLPNPPRPSGGYEPPDDDPILDGGGQAPPSSGPAWTPEPLPAGGSGPVPWISTPAGHAMAPGGVIGEPIRGAGPAGAAGARGAGAGLVPMAGGGPAGRAGGSGAAKGGFVAPPGGLIGGRPGAGSTGPVPAGRGSRRHVDDDEAFVVPSGVSGVLTPPDDPDDHRPGPGVIGIDR